MLEKKKFGGAACVGMGLVSAGLVSTWDTARAADFSFTGSITPTHTLSSAYFVFSVGACQGGGTFAEEIAASLPANVTTDFSFTINGIPDGLRKPGDATNYTIVALYDAANGGVAVAYNSGVAALLLAENPAPTWDGTFMPGEGFGGLFFQFVGDSEANVASALQGGTFNSLLIGGSPSQAPLSAGDVSNFTLVDFSAAAPGGSGTLTEVVPEPSMGAIISAAGCFVASGIRRSRRKRTG